MCVLARHRRPKNISDIWIKTDDASIIGAVRVLCDHRRAELLSTNSIAHYCKPCVRFSVSLLINRIGKLVITSTYNERFDRRKDSHNVLARSS